MSPDSVRQLKQARSASYDDWHPPIMALVWGILDSVIPGPVGMLVFHNILFWSGLGLTISLVAPRSLLAPVLVLAVGFFPSVFALLSTIWKDVGMASALLLAFSLLLYADRRSSGSAFVLSLVCLLYAFAVRHNAALAIFPFALWSGHIAWKVFRPRCTASLAAALGLGGIIFVILGSSVPLINYGLLNAQRRYPIQQIFVYDLVGVSIRTNRVFLPSYLQTTATGPSITVTVQDLQRIYTPNTLVPLFRRVLRLARDPGEVSELVSTWLATIPRHPKAYLGHRAGIFARQFGLTGSPFNPFMWGIMSNDLGIRFHPTALNRTVMRGLIALKTGPVFRGWLYLLATAVLLRVVVARGGRLLVPGLVLGSSGLLYSLPYFVVATTAEFRLYWWMVVASLVLAVVAFSRPSQVTTPL